ncbi:GlsB/YeaQ/YmgE family stress response membrane protein [Mesorhizobium sp. WSM2239]|uniref:GlsB/YeaQ/YmgE family stress response membrane protein n=2 Tax=unclassified Mesorhizobium TaxID=325217 RepID=A0AAU8DIM1_9HYPH
MEQSVGIMGMPGVGFFGMLLIGFLAGYVAEKAMSRNHGLLTNILVGIAGSFVGGTLAGLLNIQYQGFLGNLIVAVAGAVLLLWIFGRAKASGVN